VGAVADLTTHLLGQDPRAYEARFADMARTHAFLRRRNRGQGDGGDRRRAVDIKRRSLGISVARSSAGRRANACACMSHCGTTRVRHHHLVGKAPIESWNDITALAKKWSRAA